MEMERTGGPNYNKKCVVCGATPCVETTDLCGPCCFGEADEAGEGS